MNLRDAAQIIRKRWRVMVGCLLVVVGTVTALTLLAKPTYTATIRMFVAATSADIAGGNAYQGSLFTQERVLSYAGLVDTPQVTGPVAQQLGLSASDASTLPDRIKATVPANTVLIDVTVTDRNAVRARDLANAIGRQFPQVVATLETVSALQGSPVDVRVVQPASTPGSPSSPRRTLDLGFGLLLGLAVGVGGVFLRESLDTSITSAAEVTQVFDLAAIGTVPKDPTASRFPVVFDSAGRSNRIEALRKIRTNLMLSDPNRRPRSILVTSSVTGEGKTALCVNLAIAVAQSHVRVVLIDGDLRRPQVAALLSVPESQGLAGVVAGKGTVTSALRACRFEGLRVLPTRTPPANPTEILSAPALGEMIRDLHKQADVVIIDAPPTLPAADAAVLSGVVDAVVVVVQHGVTKKRQLNAALDCLHAVGAPIAGFVLNMVPPRGPEGYEERYGYGYYHARAQLRSAEADSAPAARAAADGGSREARLGS